jgi:DNA-binding transcriptional ArsR family regulator
MPVECVYLIGSEASTLVKIGRSIDVPGRLATLRAMSPVPLTLLWQTLGGAELEAALHRRFDARRAHGEWFDFPDGDAVGQVVRALPQIAAEMQRSEYEPASRIWLAPATHRQTILRLAVGGVSNRMLVRQLGVSPATAHRYLAALGEEGAIEMRGRGRGATWRIVTNSSVTPAEVDAE